MNNLIKNIFDKNKSTSQFFFTKMKSEMLLMIPRKTVIYKMKYLYL